MSIPFSRSMRSLEADSARTVLLSLFIVALLLGVWLAWLFLARITLYEVSERARVVGGVTVEAEVSPAALGRIRPGQPARLRLDSFPWIQYGTVPATVTGIAREPREGRLQVKLTLQPSPNSRISLQHGQTGTVEIEVERVSPAALVLRAAGQLVDPSDSGAELQDEPGASP